MHNKIETVIRKIIHVLEFIIAVLTLLVLVGMLGLEIYRMVTVNDYFSTIDHFLQNILTIVVGLGVPGIWLALSFEMLVRAIVLRRRVRGDKWYQKHQMKTA